MREEQKSDTNQFVCSIDWYFTFKYSKRRHSNSFLTGVFIELPPKKKSTNKESARKIEGKKSQHFWKKKWEAKRYFSHFDFMVFLVLFSLNMSAMCVSIFCPFARHSQIYSEMRHCNIVNSFQLHATREPVDSVHQFIRRERESLDKHIRRQSPDRANERKQKDKDTLSELARLMCTRMWIDWSYKNC